MFYDHWALGLCEMAEGGMGFCNKAGGILS